MKKYKPDIDLAPAMALEAIRDDVGLAKDHATLSAEPLDFIVRLARSNRTGEPTEYHYQSFGIDASILASEYPVFAAKPVDKRYPTLWLPYDELISNRHITWSTRQIARAIVDRQDVALGVITRLGRTETEYLLVWNDHYGGYFFPAQRITDDASPAFYIRQAIAKDIGYRGLVDIESINSIDVDQFSHRFQRERGFLFRIYSASPIEVLDFLAPDSQLTSNVPDIPRPVGKAPFIWLTANQVESPLPGVVLSPTISSVWPTIKGAIPPQARATLRKSEAGLALITRTVAGKTEFLCQFHEKTRGYFLVGGHREDGESFRDCVIREVGEELNLTSNDFHVASQPRSALTYMARSRSTGIDTEYFFELFDVQIGDRSLTKIESEPNNRWLSAEEILEMRLHRSQSVSPDLRRILIQSGIIAAE
jgi:8-oxo-dGTP pyrophosphatase MutT (NUDIX family)